MSTDVPASTGPADPEPSSAEAERLSTQALPISFIGRAAELAAAREHLVDDDAFPHGRALIVRGDSGAGKTFFARELMRQLNDVHPDGLFLYVDVANDEYQSTRVIASLLKTALIAGPMTGTSRISVPERLSLARYRRQHHERRIGRGLLRAIASAIGSVFGFGTAVNTALSTIEPGQPSELEDELTSYLAWAAKDAGVFLAVDNLQFMNLDTRLTLESVVQRAGHKLRFIVLDRTVDGSSQLDPALRCFTQAQRELTLVNFTSAETEAFIAGAITADPQILSALARDIFIKTNGLGKDVEYCVRQYALELGRGARVGAIEGLLSTISRLPLIHRQFLVIAALLDGGVVKAIARGTVSRLAAAYDAQELDAVVDELIAQDYLRLNGESGDRLRPGHERIVAALRELADDDLQEEVRRSLIAELVAALDSPQGESAETYLLHCLVGLQTAQELAHNIRYISRLIQEQHRQDQFSYLVAIADELQEILPLLPAHALDDLLDAMQKSSAFEQGLQILQLLDAHHVPEATRRRLFRLKYLTQAYRFDEALALADGIEDGEWRAVYQINTLMALDRDDEARAIADAHLTPGLSEAQAILRRNTISLFDRETALGHLDEAYHFFERDQSDFRLGTVDTNRSLVYLDAGHFGDALRCLERAVERMRLVGSREVYQAQLNLGIRSALLGDYEAGLASFAEAALHVPRALLFDQVKIRIAQVAVSCAAEMIDHDACQQELAVCGRRIRGLQMPYLHDVLAANLSAAQGQNGPPLGGDEGRVRLTAALPVGGVSWALPMSVHWRY